VTIHRLFRGAGAAAILAAASLAATAPAQAAGTRLFVPPPSDGAVQQIFSLALHGRLRDAARLARMEATPRAVWLTGGTPLEVRKQVRDTMRQAALERAVPTFVLYDLPFRDCGQYSAGGALDTASYLAWVDGVVAGIGGGTAQVMLEPDGLGIIPYNVDLGGNLEWCRPDLTGTGLTPATANSERYVQLNGAVQRLGANPNVSVYLDGTHSGWLGAGDAARRLVRAGVANADGFFLNLSNFQPTPQLVKYGTWVSGCIAFAANADEGGWRLGHYDWCASQYYPANPADFSTWHLTDEWYAANLGAAVPTTHFVVDTSRNGRGTLNTAPYAGAPYNQPPDVIAKLNGGSWCNPPGAGLGLRPTTSTGVSLLDAYLWIKTPGQSDGSCDIAGGARGWDYTRYNPWGLTGDAQNHFDPLWGLVDPAAGAWFPQQALDLSQNAEPPLG
jgi:endoglucanase